MHHLIKQLAKATLIRLGILGIFIFVLGIIFLTLVGLHIIAPDGRIVFACLIIVTASVPIMIAAYIAVVKRK